jgi:hypothetical protein
LHVFLIRIIFIMHVNIFGVNFYSTKLWHVMEHWLYVQIPVCEKNIEFEIRYENGGYEEFFFINLIFIIMINKMQVVPIKSFNLFSCLPMGKCLMDFLLKVSSLTPQFSINVIKIFDIIF